MGKYINMVEQSQAKYADKKVAIVNATRFDWNKDLEYTKLKELCQV